MRCCPKLNLLLYTWFYLNSNTDLLRTAPSTRTDTNRDVRAKWFLLSFSCIRTHAYKYKLNPNIYRQSSTWRREYALYFVRMYVHTHKHTHKYLCLYRHTAIHSIIHLLTQTSYTYTSLLTQIWLLTLQSTTIRPPFPSLCIKTQTSPSSIIKRLPSNLEACVPSFNSGSARSFLLTNQPAENLLLNSLDN